MSKAKAKWLVARGQWLVQDELTSNSHTGFSPNTTHQSPIASSVTTASRRRGVLLLVVLSLLVLFSLVAVTFVLVAGRYYDAARNQIKVEQTGDNPAALLDEVFAQCIRDTDNPNSVLRGHSLLDDLYGNDGIRYDNAGTALNVTPSAVAQILDITFTPSTYPIYLAAYPNTPVPATAAAGNPASLVLSLDRLQTPGFYNGCILTALDGAAKNKSTRILGWNYTGTSYAIRIKAFDGVPWSDLNANKPTKFVINGRPFNGTGFGFKPSATPATDATLLNNVQIFTGPPPTSVTITAPYALLGNPVYFDGQSGTKIDSLSVPPPTVNYPQFGGIGGADEDYDAPDPQNMLLAHIPLNSTAGVSATNPYLPIVPSLHRPETIEWLRKSIPSIPTDPLSTDPVSKLINRQSSLRPTPNDHPLFPRLAFDYTGDGVPDPSVSKSLVYDVDNDGDGVAESIWVDAGLPVRTGADGRTYKPMVAVLCLDLDSRLNVNAHGNVAQLNANYPNAIPTGTGATASISNYLFTTGGTAAATPLSRGLGFGPAEINLNVLFSNPTTEYKALFQGGTYNNILYEGRYGESGSTPTNAFSSVMAGNSMGSNGPDDVLAKLKRYGTPNYYFGIPSQYGSPGDMWGRMALGLDYAGQPVYSYSIASGTEALPTGTNLPNPEMPNDPYSVNLTRARAVQNAPTTNDNLFSIAELERVLRPYDNDSASLPNRLRTLLNPVGANNLELSKVITTDSNDLAAPAGPVSRDLAAARKTQTGSSFSGSGSFIDLVRTKMVASGSYTTANVGAAIATLANKGVIAPELLAGQRFDVNRPFGNGRDDDNDGIIDEPDEYSFNNINEVPITWNGITGFTKPTFMDLNRDGNTIADPQEGYKARVTYAKQLYFLMMTLADLDYAWGIDNGAALTNVAQQRELTSRRIAQWAINAVDFRDADSIMTPFEYDANPFNGWDVDGLVTASDPNAMNPDRRVVWGVERPELLLTETLAFHDRRVADTDQDPSGKDMSDTMTPDTDYDQIRVPQGSLFLELYCPRSPLNAQTSTAQIPFPSDLYTSGKLNLGAIAPGQSPVWRVAITRSTAQAANMLSNRVQNHRDLGTFDPPIDASTDIAHGSFFDPSSAETQLLTERFIWFSNLNPTSDSNPETASHSVFWNQNNTNSLLSPGQFAVVGPRPQTYIGLTTGGTGANQKIVLDPTNNQAQVFDTTNTATTSNNIVAMVCTSTVGSWPPIGMSVSEPPLASYYGAVPSGLGPTGATDKYSAPQDIPLDDPSQTPTSPLLGALATGVRPQFRFALLQRLADPKQAFNATTNPYITVDWQGIDLTVFNGESLQSSVPDPSDPTLPATLAFGSRQRGSVATGKNIWNPTLLTPPVASGPVGASAVFNFSLSQPLQSSNSLGYLNKAFGTPWGTGATVDLAIYSQMPQPSGIQPFTYPWLTWNNRPYISGAELMLVPAASAEQMLRYFSAPSSAAAGLAGSAYEQLPAAYYLPFGHLFNFRQSGNGSASSGPNFARVLEYLTVPTPYVGLDEYVNLTAPLPAANGAPAMMAPFNVISENREPGRVNINTIAGFSNLPDLSVAWRGLRDSLGVERPGPFWKEVVASRRGDVPAGPTYTATSPTTLSSYFARPFRSAAGAAYSLPGAYPAGTTPNEIEATMLRQSVSLPGRGLFENTTTGTPYADPIANAYFHHQPIQRLNNLITTRSNVYAIWLTVGYFEVRPAASSGPGTPYPDGYELMQEMGSDTGEVVRHRAFYIYDRSIPVGFERGKDHNFADGLLLKRFIE